MAQGAGAAVGNETRGSLCTVAIDVRGLDRRFERDLTTFVYDPGGNQLWPDSELVQGVSSRLVNEGNLQSYVTSEAQLAGLPNLTRVKALKVQPSKFSPNSPYFTDAVLDSVAAARFRSAGMACRLVYLKD